MIEHIHKHITSELNQNTRTDTIFILTSIIGSQLRNLLRKERDGSTVLPLSNKEPRRLFASSADRAPGRGGVQPSDAGVAEGGRVSADPLRP